MKDSRLDRIQSVFLAALEVPSDTRIEWLKKECVSDPALYSAVVKLLAHDLGTNDPLEQPLAKALGDLPTSSNFELLSATEFQSKRSTQSGNVRRNAIPEELRKFEDYELLEEIARGGMGVVYKAKQVSLDRIVALKMILAGQFAGTQEIDRFRAEAEAAANLDHPGIVPIFEIGTHQGQHFFSMAYVDGESLSQHLSHGPLAPKAAAKLLLQVANAISYAHSKGVIHRDLKPANVMIESKSQKARVTDFGLAKRNAADANLTQTGQIIGTPAYMPPEQASGEHSAVDEKSDIYSLGSILFSLLTGSPPFKGASATDVILQVLNNDPTPPRQLNHRVDKDLDTICQECMSKEKSKRYASARELIMDLSLYIADRPVKARPIGAFHRALRWSKRNKAQSVWIGAFSLSLSYPLILGFVGIAGVLIATFRSPTDIDSLSVGNGIYMDTLNEDGTVVQALVAVQPGVFASRITEAEKVVDFAFEEPIALRLVSGRIKKGEFRSGAHVRLWTEVTALGETKKLFEHEFDLRALPQDFGYSQVNYTLIRESSNEFGQELWHWCATKTVGSALKVASDTNSNLFLSPVFETRYVKRDYEALKRESGDGASVKKYLQKLWPPKTKDKGGGKGGPGQITGALNQSWLGALTRLGEEQVLIEYKYVLGSVVTSETLDKDCDVILRVKCRLLDVPDE